MAIPNGYTRIEANKLYENVEYYIDTTISYGALPVSNIRNYPYIGGYREEGSNYIVVYYDGGTREFGGDGGWFNITNGIVTGYPTLNINLTTSPDWLYVKTSNTPDLSKVKKVNITDKDGNEFSFDVGGGGGDFFYTRTTTESGTTANFSTNNVLNISFTVYGSNGTTTYIAESGMTWSEWIESDYNTGGFYVYNGMVKNGETSTYLYNYYKASSTYVYVSNVIYDGMVYSTSSPSSNVVPSYINKVVLSGEGSSEVLFDLSSTTATPDTVLKGHKFKKADGSDGVGSFINGLSEAATDADMTNYLVGEYVGKIIHFTGTSPTYENGRYYLITTRPAETEFKLAQAGVTYEEVDYKIDTTKSYTLPSTSYEENISFTNGNYSGMTEWKMYYGTNGPMMMYKSASQKYYPYDSTKWNTSTLFNGRFTYGPQWFKYLTLPSNYTTNTWLYVKNREMIIAEPLYRASEV